MEELYLFDWVPIDEKDIVCLLYPDGTYLKVSFDDFNSWFGVIISATKSVVQKDFAIKY